MHECTSCFRFVLKVLGCYILSACGREAIRFDPTNGPYLKEFEDPSRNNRPVQYTWIEKAWEQVRLRIVLSTMRPSFRVEQRGLPFANERERSSSRLLPANCEWRGGCLTTTTVAVAMNILPIHTKH